MKIQFQLNGKLTEVEFEAQETLAEVLRNRLNLTGTKVSCEVQVCGACTVLVDGLPVSACTLLAYEAREREVLTIEGLAKPDGTLHPIQQAFIDEFAFQWLLHARHDPSNQGAPGRKSQTDARRDRSLHGRKHLPLHRLCADSARDSEGSSDYGEKTG